MYSMLLLVINLIFLLLIGECIEGDVMLLESDGLSDYTDLSSDQDDLLRGRVEVCVGGNYSTVCNNGQWDNQDASVVCRQLGLSPYGQSMNTLVAANQLIILLSWLRVYCGVWWIVLKHSPLSGPL